ncbi:actin filament-coating protein tropomyosin [Mycena vulgaris]|nr:actin filament-coating protein tropomyosin [Mycena vulgaris]KAJ6535336.1 actin filament-coating protein tropomyosin [Mycena vulgaris]
MTERVRERLIQLRNDVDAAIERAETAEAKVKTLEQALLERDHEVKSLEVRLAQSDDAREKGEGGLAEATAKLRELDVKAEQCERQMHVAEQERDRWEAKCEAVEAKYKSAKAELDELVATMEGL